MSRFTILAASALSLFALSGTANAASFSCNGHLTYTEKAICDNDGLSRADDRMASLYFSVVRNHDYRSGQVAQIEWLRERNMCGADVTCIWNEYHYRMQQLRTGYAY